MEDAIERINDDLLPSQAKAVYQTLFKIFGNILKNPGEGKFRNLGKEKKLMTDGIAKSSNAVSLLLLVGFEDRGETYTCDPATSLELMQMAFDLLEGILESLPEDTESSPVEAQTPASSRPPHPPQQMVATAKAAPTEFARKTDLSEQRAAQEHQLSAIRAERAAQAPSGVGGEWAAEPPIGSGTYAPAEDKSKPHKTKASAFDFRNRSEEEKRVQAAQESLQEMRKAQKDKYTEFQNDPAAQARAAQNAKPPSVSAGGKQESGWFGGWFAGSSSSGGSGGRDDRPDGPRVKRLSDLPKPVQRGGG